jgi:antitoxin (DNA-binding transcriptional repressor) of toxin-antitoxin stability system
MSELPVSVSADGLESWNDAVRRAEHGEVVAVIAHGKHVADVVPSGELDRLRETTRSYPIRMPCRRCTTRKPPSPASMRFASW